MPRYFFHLRNDLDVEDEEGEELPDLEAAQARAAAFALDMSAAGVLEHSRINLSHRIQVANAEGEVLHEVTFGDVVAVTR